jgi:hypothetical protein
LAGRSKKKISERERREERSRREPEDRQRLGPDIDAEGRRTDDSRGGDGPRRVGEEREAREERGQRSVHHPRGGDQGSDAERRGTSWLSVIFGWLTAFGASLILSGIVGAVVGAILGAGGASSSATEGEAVGLVGLLITLLLAFIVGGYVAGRLASRSGFKHGLLVPVVALVVTIVLAGIGALLGLSFIENLSGVTLPDVPSDAPQGLGTILTLAGILALLAPFVGGAIGGAWGAKTGRRRP